MRGSIFCVWPTIYVLKLVCKSQNRIISGFKIKQGGGVKFTLPLFHFKTTKDTILKLTQKFELINCRTDAKNWPLTFSVFDFSPFYHKILDYISIFRCYAFLCYAIYPLLYFFIREKLGFKMLTLFPPGQQEVSPQEADFNTLCAPRAHNPTCTRGLSGCF